MSKIAYTTTLYVLVVSSSQGKAEFAAMQFDAHSRHVHNLTCITVLKTAMTQKIQNDPASFQEINDAHVFGGMGEPEHVARAPVFLASDDVPLPVDGGFMCQ